MSYLEITEVILVHCNIVNNNYQKCTSLLYRFASGNSFSNLLEITISIFKQFLFFQRHLIQSFRMWFTDQNSQQLEIEHKMTLIYI